MNNKLNTAERLLFTGITLFLLTANATGSDAHKEAFDMGMKSAIKVMQYEKSQAFAPIPLGYCIEVKSVDSLTTNDFSAIKIESLALYMSLKPSLLEFVDIQGKKEKKLCFAMTDKTRAHAESILKGIRTDYPKIDSFYPTIVHIPNPKIYTRIVPGFGEMFEDKSDAIGSLAKDMEKKDRGHKNEMISKNVKIKQLEEKLARIGSMLNQNMSPADTVENKNNSDSSTISQFPLEKKDKVKTIEAEKENNIVDKLFPNVEIKKNSKYPVLSTKDSTLRFQDKDKGINVNVVDKENPRILKVKNEKNN